MKDERERRASLGETIADDTLVKAQIPVQPTHITPTTRIQARLPDGRVLKFTFETVSPLEELHAKIRGEFSDGRFELLSTFPTRIFGEDDARQTFAGLELCPSATLIVRPKK